MALAAQGELPEAERQVEQAYAADPNLKDGYARVAWQVFWPKKDYAQAAEWIEKDLTTESTESTENLNRENPAGNILPANPSPSVSPPCPSVGKNPRLSPAWLLNYAKVVAKAEGMDAAVPIIEDAYKRDPKLQNAFSQVAWQRFIPEDMAYEKVLPSFEKDIELGTLNGEWQLNYAQAYADNIL